MQHKLMSPHTKIQVQKNKFLDEASIGEIIIVNSRTEPKKDNN